MYKKDIYLTALQLKSKLKQELYNKNANKLQLISQYRKELSELWPVIYKKQYFERFYAIHTKKWITTKRHEAIFIINISSYSETDKLITFRERTDIVFSRDRFLKINTTKKSSNDENINSSQSLNLKDITDEQLLKVIKEYNLFIRFSDNIEAITSEPSKRLLKDHEEEEILNLLHKLLD